MPQITTSRLDLLPLTPLQLQQYLEHPEFLEQGLGFPVSRAILTETVQRAIRMKLAKMEKAEATKWVWYTYWLILVRAVPFGAGLAGFKGVPDQNGEVEIGYGIDPGYEGQGYMTETVRAMIRWAFEEPSCRAVIAPNTQKWNLGSQRVLLKSGMMVCGETEDALNFRIDKIVAQTP
jgi:RimJ/RimL family protein N-acetyltransferase